MKEDEELEKKAQHFITIFGEHSLEIIEKTRNNTAYIFERVESILKNTEPYLMIDKIMDMYPDEQFLSADGFHDAIIGLDLPSMRLIYSVSKVIEIIMKEPEMSEGEAYEHFEFNVAGSYMGEKTPIWCYDNF